MTREGKYRKQVHLAAHFPGVNNTTVWSDPTAGSQIDFDSFVHLARTAERGRLDFFFLAEGLRLREHRGRIHDLDVVGRPDTFTVLAAWPAVTERIGLAGTINTTFNEPFEVARQFASLDHLSDGRAAWNMVTSSDAFTGANFRRGGFLDHADRYRRAEDFVTVAREFWDSWDLSGLAGIGPGSTPTGSAPVHHRSRSSTSAESPPCPPGRRAIRCCCRLATPTRAVTSAPGTPTRCSRCTGRSRPGSGTTPTSRRVRPRTAAIPTNSRSFPVRRSYSATAPADADEKAHHIRRQQVSPQTAIAMLEQVWQTRPVGLRPRRSAARRRTGRRPDGHPGPGAPRRPEGAGRRLARTC